MARIFIYNGAELEDLNPGGSPDDVRKAYAGVYPALTNSSIVGPTKRGEDAVYEFKVSVGTKG
jgi:PRTRC genetic system protein C